ncbi:MAG: ornithine cyclodeaminase family protein, partial [Chloroflexota bacterium]
MNPINITYLGGPEIEQLHLTPDEILTAIEASLVAQGNGETVIEPRAHLIPNPKFRGHFNVLRGYISSLGEDGGIAGVKIVGDYVDNYKKGLPSELAMLNLMNAKTGAPIAMIDASEITDMRTGAVTAVGAKHLAP